MKNITDLKQLFQKITAIYTRILIILKILSRYLIFFIVALIILFFSFRGVVLHYSIHLLSGKFNHKFNTELVVKEDGFSGIRGIYLKKCSIIPNGKDTLFRCDSLFVRINFWPLLFGKIRFSKFNIYNADLIFTSKDDYYIPLTAPKDTFKSASITGQNLSYTINKLLKKLFSSIPDQLLLSECKIINSSEGENSEVTAKNLTIHDQAINGTVMITKNKKDFGGFHITGSVDKKKKSMIVRLSTVNNKIISFPLLEQRFNIYLGFDSALYSLSVKDYSASVLKLQIEFQINNLHMKHPKLAKEDVVIKHSQLYLNMNIGENYFEIDSNSLVNLNQITFQPYLKYEPFPERKMVLKIPDTEWEAKSFFNSLPEGIFNNIKGLDASGNLYFSLYSSIDWSNLDSLKFETNLDKKDFKIRHFGNTNLCILNDTFIHEVYDNDSLVTSFIVGPQNPYYTPLPQISPILINTVQTSEDGSFFYHKGFNPESFRKAIADDLKAKRFVRGGSTISMQLVKNIFLTKNKTVSRKIEEALIVWLIENMHLVSKERMIEIYLNIIEWGPGIYGIGQASEFYFNKKPADLNLSESVFLACIIPNPKYFKFYFVNNGKTSQSYKDFSKIVVNFLIKRNLINIQDTTDFNMNITLTGKALGSFAVNDTMKIDSMAIDEMLNSLEK